MVPLFRNPFNVFSILRLRKFTLGNNSVESPRCTDKALNNDLWI